GELEAALDGGGGLVVEQALVPAVALEDQLAGEEHRAREPQGDLAAQPVELGDGLGTGRRVALGGPAEVAPGERDVAGEVALDVVVQRVDLVLALERAGV